MDSLCYDGAFGQGPGGEAHGGSTYCAVASLKLMGVLDQTIAGDRRDALLQWLVNRQKLGFHGRTCKPDDTCYSFWIVASLAMLDQVQLIDTSSNRGFLLTTQTSYGGFAKWPEYPPDLLHSYFGVCGFSLMKFEGLQPLDVALNISERAKARLASISSTAAAASS